MCFMRRSTDRGPDERDSHAVLASGTTYPSPPSHAGYPLNDNRIVSEAFITEPSTRRMSPTIREPSGFDGSHENLTPLTWRYGPFPTDVRATPCSSISRSRAPEIGKVTTRVSSAKRKIDSI